MFEDKEDSRALGEPVDLYLFVYGPGASDHYAYTDAETEVVFDSITYSPIPIMREGIKSSGTLDKSAINITTDGGAAIAELFRVYPPTQVVTLIIRQGHLNDVDAEFLVIWTGRVLSCKRIHSEAELTCEPVATSMKRNGLRRHWQYSCPHALYMGNASGGCRASKVAATEATTVAAISGGTITLPEGWNGARDKLKFQRGMVEWTNAAGATESRTILRVNATTNVLDISGLIRDLAVDDPINVILGCSNQLDDCGDLHDNINDFGGQWLIPTKNPIGTYNNYY